MNCRGRCGVVKVDEFLASAVRNFYLSYFDMTLPEERKVQAKLAVRNEYTFDFVELSPEYSEHE